MKLLILSFLIHFIFFCYFFIKIIQWNNKFFLYLREASVEFFINYFHFLGKNLKIYFARHWKKEWSLKYFLFLFLRWFFLITPALFIILFFIFLFDIIVRYFFIILEVFFCTYISPKSKYFSYYLRIKKYVFNKILKNLKQALKFQPVSIKHIFWKVVFKTIIYLDELLYRFLKYLVLQAFILSEFCKLWFRKSKRGWRMFRYYFRFFFLSRSGYRFIKRKIKFSIWGYKALLKRKKLSLRVIIPWFIYFFGILKFYFWYFKAMLPFWIKRLKIKYYFKLLCIFPVWLFAWILYFVCMFLYALWIIYMLFFHEIILWFYFKFKQVLNKIKFYLKLIIGKKK